MEGLISKLVPRPRSVLPLSQSAGEPAHLCIAASPFSASFQLSSSSDSNLTQTATFLSSKLSQLLGETISPSASGASGSSESPQFVFAIRPSVVPKPQGYRIIINPSSNQIDLIGNCPSGLFYSACTLFQLIRCSIAPPSSPLQIMLPAIVIEDYPDILNRGYMLDISRDKVPTMETLYYIIDLLSILKYNQLQLYTEHTFAYAGHEIVWKDSSPITPEEMKKLESFCAQRYISLVPNQNSFGHMHRWLKHAPYRPLAECPEGFEHGFNDSKDEPYSLCPLDDRSLSLLEDLYTQLLPCFPNATLFNVGLDETVDLGVGRSKEECAKDSESTGRLYLSFLKKVVSLAQQVHHRLYPSAAESSCGPISIQCWADILTVYPNLISELPDGASFLPMIWGYEKDSKFVDTCKSFATRGISSYVCPGTSSWNSFAGRSENSLRNIVRAVKEGVEAGAIGSLLTDWGDHGHMQPLCTSFPAMFAHAEASWNTSLCVRNEELMIQLLYDKIPQWIQYHICDGAEKWNRLGTALLELGNTYRIASGLPDKPLLSDSGFVLDDSERLLPNQSALFSCVIFWKKEKTRPCYMTANHGVTLDALSKAKEHVTKIMNSLKEQVEEGHEFTRFTSGIMVSCHFLLFACDFQAARRIRIKCL